MPNNPTRRGAVRAGRQPSWLKSPQGLDECPTSTARSQFLNTLALLLIATLRRPYTRGYEPWLLDLVASGFAGARTEFGPDLGGHAQSTFPIYFGRRQKLAPRDFGRINGSDYED